LQDQEEGTQEFPAGFIGYPILVISGVWGQKKAIEICPVQSSIHWKILLRHLFDRWMEKPLKGHPHHSETDLGHYSFYSIFSISPTGEKHRQERMKDPVKRDRLEKPACLPSRTATAKTSEKFSVLHVETGCQNNIGFFATASITNKCLLFSTV